MKKLMLLFAFLITAMTSMAKTYTGHLKFEGVAIDGTVEKFVSKVSKKGYKGDYKIPQVGEATSYFMSGKYLDRFVNVEVRFDGPTRIVYDVVLTYDGIALERAERELQYLREQIIKQYPNEEYCYDRTDHNGNPCFILRPMRTPGTYTEVWTEAVGQIEISITEDDTVDKESNPERYGIEIRYTDSVNADRVAVG